MSAPSGGRPGRLRVIVIALLLVGESAYFGGRCAAGFARLIGERAYFAGDPIRAWTFYDRAAELGSDPVQVMTDRAEVLLFGLDQRNLGIRIDLPFEPAEVPGVARGIVSSMLAAAPYRAYFWSLAADVHTDEALAQRRSTPLDLSSLSDNPLENLLPQEGMAVAALREAVRREPTNYIYEDLLAEKLGEWGLDELAAPHVRRAVAMYPVLEGHLYLARPRLEPEIVDAALDGFADAVHLDSMVPVDAVEVEAGRFLVSQGRHQEALSHLERAIAVAPANPDAVYWRGVANYLVGNYAAAMEDLSRASYAFPDTPYLWYQLGQSRLKLNRRDEAVLALRRARELDPRQVLFFHALGEALEGGGAVKEAERQFQAAANLNPGDASAWVGLLHFYERHTDLGPAARRVCGRLRQSRVPSNVYHDLCAALLRSGA